MLHAALAFGLLPFFFVFATHTPHPWTATACPAVALSAFQYFDDIAVIYTGTTLLLYTLVALVLLLFVLCMYRYYIYDVYRAVSHRTHILMYYVPHFRFFQMHFSHLLQAAVAFEYIIITYTYSTLYYCISTVPVPYYTLYRHVPVQYFVLHHYSIHCTVRHEERVMFLALHTRYTTAHYKYTVAVVSYPQIEQRFSGSICDRLLVPYSTAQCTVTASVINNKQQVQYSCFLCFLF